MRPQGPRGGTHGIPGWGPMGTHGGGPMGSHGGTHGIPGWALGDPLALGDLGPWGPGPFGGPGPWA